MDAHYREYIELAEPLLTERALLVIDNLLVGGEVALPEGSEGRHSAESVASARAEAAAAGLTVLSPTRDPRSAA